jgi:hypothetical protein
MVRCRSKLVLALLVAALGCTGGDATPPVDEALSSPTAAQMRSLANMYLDYVTATKGDIPPSEEDLKKHIRSQPGMTLSQYDIDRQNIDSLFASLRDHEPLNVVYGGRLTVLSGNSKQVVAHEKTGVNGKKLVVFASTKVDHVDDQELQRLLSAAAAPAAPQPSVAK